MSVMEKLLAVEHTAGMFEDPVSVCGLLDEAAREIEGLQDKLDALGVAICNAGYTWTPGMRDAYERPAVMPKLKETDLGTCPQCGGPADNGHDRCLPPSPYLCTKCTKCTKTHNV